MHTMAEKIRRFPKESKQRRRDRKHRFTLRIPIAVWSDIQELQFNCGGSTAGATFNCIIEQLISQALTSQDIIANIMNHYPEKPEIIKIRNWGHVNES